MIDVSNQVLIVHFNPFDTFSKVDVVTPAGVSKSLLVYSLFNHGIGELIDIAYSLNSFDIYFDGPVDFIEEINRKATAIESMKYNNNKITIKGV